MRPAVRPVRPSARRHPHGRRAGRSRRSPCGGGGAGAADRPRPGPGR
ncbi:hypothetical protein KCH_56120 [Kitasatospora cheerisanensis KCTC 2395]|uniref:Uncharacterized protein n=1 Tax=Kitasatospora cheerisanensis KCTC 2395 TaxID=1348663 RepID=A0A066YNH2_9ACTN|nr:hypothetical protein KCH_56120 [Kitasatospora cheerisanensis KCTC 2395]